MQRIATLTLTSFAILTTAASCTLPGLDFGSRNDGQILGVLKRDPSISSAFGKINSVKLLDNTSNPQGLTTVPTLKIEQISSDEFYLLTRTKGLFYTDSGGKQWSRKYIFPVTPNNQQTQTQLIQNDSLIGTELKIDSNNPKVLFYAGIQNDIGKIYRSVNGGKNFDEVYSAVDTNTSIISIAIDPNNNANVFGLLNQGTLIRSQDSGQSWSKMRDFNDQAIQLGFVPEFDNLFYILLRSKGLWLSPDEGETWSEQKLTRTKSTIGETQGSRLNFSNKSQDVERFSKFESIVPIKADKDNWLIIADKQLWLGESLNQPFNKLVFPLPDERFDFAGLAADPQKGKSRILASIDNQLFETKNQGQSWSTSTQPGLANDIGNISSITLDKNNSEIIYLTILE
ncbi:hypothetical protein HC766_01455 [Candidatus Gracilibacteria bacterium]|nr:hypothetical protein [Candidatus Gracilibacteria bacterium]